jgi:pimeloyl-ACP methyl ester carboxylesterase
MHRLLCMAAALVTLVRRQQDAFSRQAIGHIVSGMFRWPVTVPAFVRFGGAGAGPVVATPPRIEHVGVKLDDRTAGVGIADGGGPNVLFLHGWGLTHHSYASPIRALAATGYRVIAPDLPGFGRTDDLPAGGVSFSGFAAFVDGLLDAMEIDEPVHVVGHSFGGGVATQFTHDFPGRVRSLVLVDAVSGATWTRSGSDARLLATRPLWDWAFHLLLELPMATNPRAVPSLLGEVATNLVRHPASLGLVAHLIRRSDLRAELAALHERGTAVSVVWGSGDKVVPRAAYDDLCEALGSVGETVPGTHSWLLSSPDRFAASVHTAISAVESPSPSL